MDNPLSKRSYLHYVRESFKEVMGTAPKWVFQGSLVYVAVWIAVAVVEGGVMDYMLPYRPLFLVALGVSALGLLLRLFRLSMRVAKAGKGLATSMKITAIPSVSTPVALLLGLLSIAGVLWIQSEAHRKDTACQAFLGSLGRAATTPPHLLNESAKLALESAAGYFGVSVAECRGRFGGR